MIVLDADFIVAFFRKEDENNIMAVKLMEEIEQDAILSIITLSEVITIIKSRDGSKRAAQVWEIIKNADIEILEVIGLLGQIYYFIEKYDSLSFGDASSVAIMKQRNISKIISFDSDFDLIPGIQRIY